MDSDTRPSTTTIDGTRRRSDTVTRRQSRVSASPHLRVFSKLRFPFHVFVAAEVLDRLETEPLVKAVRVDARLVAR